MNLRCSLILKFITAAAFIWSTHSYAVPVDCATFLDSDESQQQVLADFASELNDRFGFDSDPWLGLDTFDATHSRLKQLAANQSIVSRGLKQLHSIEITPSLTLALLNETKEFVETVLQSPQPSQREIWQASTQLQLMSAILEREKTIHQIQNASLPTEERQTDNSNEEHHSPVIGTPHQEPLAVDEYNPFNKDTAGTSSADQKLTLVAEFSENVAYFATSYLNVVRLNEKPMMIAAPIPGLKTNIPSHHTDIKMKLHYLEPNQEKPLLIPQGWQPNRSLNGDTLRRESNGRYLVTGQDRTVTLSMRKHFEILNPIATEFLKTPVGVPPDAWPPEMKLELFTLVKGMPPLLAAAKVESYIRNKYLYRVDADDSRDPIEALNRGAFQCDIAAFIMVGIMRDVLGIPARAVLGYRARSDGKNGSVLKFPSQGHAWVEVYHDGLFHVYDPTPKNKDRKTDEQNDLGELGDNQKEYDQEFEEADMPQENVEESAASDKSKQKSQEISETKESVVDDRTTDEILQALTVGQLKIRDSRSQNKLISRFFRIILREAVRPDLSTEKSLQRLMSIQAALKTSRTRDPEIARLVTAAIPIFRFRASTVEEELIDIKIALRKKSLNSTYARLLNVEDRLTLYLNLLDQDQFSREKVGRVFKSIRTLKERYRELVKDGFDNISIVQKFIQNIPPHAAALFQKRFGLDNSGIGSNMETQNAARALRSGKVNDLNLIRHVYPMTNFITDAIPWPGYKNILTWNIARFKGRHLVPLDDPRYARDAILLNPNKSVFQSIRDGTAFLKVRRKKNKVPSPGGVTDPQRVTIALYDVSGSMTGSPGIFQAGLLAAFTDQALSDIGPNGNHRHKVVLMGFGDKIYEKDDIYSSQLASELIQDYARKLGNKPSSTNIQLALEQALLAILNSQDDNNGQPLAAANIILMTDGEANVDLTEIRKLMARIDRRTRVKILFVGIGDPNDKLYELSRQLYGVGFDESYYDVKETVDIEKIVNLSQLPVEFDQTRDYHSDASPLDLAKDAENLLSNAASDVVSLFAEVLEKLRPHTLNYWQNQIDQMKVRRSTIDDKTLFDAQMGLLQVEIERFAPLNDSKTIEYVMNDILINLENLTSGVWAEFHQHDRQRLNWVMSAAKARAAGKAVFKD